MRLKKSSTSIGSGRGREATTRSKTIDAGLFKGKYPIQVRFKDWGKIRLFFSKVVMQAACNSKNALLRSPVLSEEQQQRLRSKLQTEFDLEFAGLP